MKSLPALDTIGRVSCKIVVNDSSIRDALLFGPWISERAGEHPLAPQRPSRHPLSISVFFPCYNEEANVERTTLAAMETFERVASDFEIIIVNDGSQDRTRAIADQLAARLEPVRAVHNETNLGYGGALQRGFREATKPWVFYTDGDGQFDFNEIDRLIPLLEEADIVSAYRTNRQDPLLRKINAWGWTTLVNTLFRMRIRDMDCAFKIFPRSLFDQIEMKSNGALIDAEILARATRLGYSIAQIGVTHFPRHAGTQTGASFSVILRAFAELFALHWEIRRSQSGFQTASPPDGGHGDRPLR